MPDSSREGRAPSHSDYLDFELEISPGHGREYPVAVLGSPVGEARATMHFPFDELALENRLLNLQNALLRSGGKHRRMPLPEEQAVQDFGQALFDALICSDVRSRYDVSWREAARRGKGLRLKLRIHPPELGTLPWEYMYDPRQDDYVCLSRRTPIVRYLESPHPLQPLAVTPPLRILGMITSPDDLPSLDIDREKRRVERALQALRRRGLVELHWLPGQTWNSLQEAMWGGPWHILHFVGHGGFDRNADESFVVLTDSKGRSHRLNATLLGRLLADHNDLRLVLLNSCEGAQGSEHDIFSSTASILVRRGIPAVVSMQYEITDRAAIEFARAFYRALAHGLPVDEAVVAARKAISVAVTNTIEWGTPVLYMRSPDGVLFHVTDGPDTTEPEGRVPAVRAELDAELEKRLERLYVDGRSAVWIEDWDEACHCFQAIVDEQPDYRDAAVKLERAQRERQLVSLYTEAQTARAAKDWTREFLALDRLVAEAPDFRDAADLHEAAKRQRQLAKLYARAQELHAAGRWQAVINVLRRIVDIDPEYPDADGLLASARRELVARECQAELDDLYKRAVRAMDASLWAEARRLLLLVREQEPGHRATVQLLERVEVEIQRLADARQRQEQIAPLYEKAVKLAHAGKWYQVMTTLNEIHALDPQFDDPQDIVAQAQAELRRLGDARQRQAQIASLYEKAEKLAHAGKWYQVMSALNGIHALDPHFDDPQGLVAQAQAVMSRETRDAQRREKLADLYADAVRLLRARQYRQALEKWSQVQALDPHYPDAKRVEATARRELAAKDRPAPWHRLPGWALAAIGGLVVVGFVLGALRIAGMIGPMPTPTPTVTSTATRQPDVVVLAGAVLKRLRGEVTTEQPATGKADAVDVAEDVLERVRKEVMTEQPVVRTPDVPLVATPTPRPPTATPEPPTATPRPPTPTPAPTPALPVLAGTPVPGPLAVISTDNAAQLQQLARWGKGSLEEVAYSPDGTLLAVASSLGVYLYDAETLEEVRHIETQHVVRCVAFSPDGETLASGLHDGTVQLWRVFDGARLHTLEGHTSFVDSVAFSPDGLTLASGSWDDTVQLWRVSDGVRLPTLEGHTSYVTSVAFSPDGATLASASWDHTVRLWRVSDRSLLRTLEGHVDNVTSVAFSPDGATLASGSWDETVRLWGVSDGALQQTLEGQAGTVYSVAFSPDGTILASGSQDGTVRLWRASDGRLNQALEGHIGSVLSVAFSPDGATLASGSSDDTVQLWRLSDGARLHTVEGYTSRVTSVAFSSDGMALASASWDCTVRLWRASDGDLLQTLEGHTGFVQSVAFSSDGSTVASGSWDRTVRLWRVSDGRLLHTLEGHTDPVESVAFSPDGVTLASGSWDKTVRVWRVSDGELLQTLTGHTGWVNSVAFSPDGATLASGSHDDTVSLWRPSDGRLNQTLEAHTGYVEDVAFSPHGVTLASGSWDDTVRLWRASDGNLLHTLEGQTGRVYALAFSPDGSTLASGSGDGVVRLWRVSDGELLRILKGHTDEVESVAFSPDGTILASASVDGTVRLWGVVEE